MDAATTYVSGLEPGATGEMNATVGNHVDYDEYEVYMGAES